MPMTVRLLAIAAIAFLIIDGIWLGFIANRFYMSQLGPLARVDGEKFDIVYWAAGVVYLLMILGTVFFVLPRVTPTDTVFTAFLWGAFFGLTIYGIYDMTNAATLARWPLLMSVVDMAWGAILCGAVTVILKLARD